MLRHVLPVAVLLSLVTVPTTALADGHCGPAADPDAIPISTIQTDDVEPAWYREVSRARLDPYATDAHDVVFSGGGWGHGVGMSQWGAQGAALDGCSAEQIIGTYFPKTNIESRPGRAELRLKLWTTDAGGVTSVWAQENTPWRACDVRTGDCERVLVQQANTTVRVRIDGNQFRLQGDGQDVTFGDRVYTVLTMQHDGRLVRVLQGDGTAKDSGRPIRYGVLEFDFTTRNGGRLFTTEVIRDGHKPDDRGAMETYLLGLDEVPFSWEPAALEAQAIAARSYAEARMRFRDISYPDTDAGDEGRIDDLDCRCDLFVTTGDQVWHGAETEGSSFDHWDAAVRETTRRYVIGEDNVVTTFYSSSHGGYSADGHAIGFTGINKPWYGGVDASAWEARSGHSRYRWTEGFSRQELQDALGVPDIDALRVSGTDAGGYPLRGAVEAITLVDGEEVVQGTFSANDIRWRLGLLSPRFVIHEITDLADDDQIPVARVAGENRAETAIRLSEAGWSDGSETVVLAREDNPADALTGSALAGTHDAPLLLTPRDGLRDDVAAEIQRLGATRVFMLGGQVALSAQVAQDLRSLGIPTVKRVQGETRHGTAVDVASRVARGDQTTAYLVRLRDNAVESRGWVDALSVAAVAARRASEGGAWPILGTEASLPDETRQAIADLGITRVVPVGGPVTIPQKVLDQLAAMDVEVAEPLAGEDRYGTSRAVTATDTPTSQSMVIATGENYPDGLAAGPYAARTGAALLLVPTELSDGSPWGDGQHPAFVSGFAWEEPELFAVGGRVAIQTPVISRVATLLENARP